LSNVVCQTIEKDHIEVPLIEQWQSIFLPIYSVCRRPKRLSCRGAHWGIRCHIKSLLGVTSLHDIALTFPYTKEFTKKDVKEMLHCLPRALHYAEIDKSTVRRLGNYASSLCRNDNLWQR
jgi:hypothetical protein